MALVYKITCSTTGKIYVGWTTLDLATRWKRHLVGDKKCYIQYCIKKYGKENFEIERLYTFEHNADAIAKEIELIRELRLNISRYPNGIGMNMTDGGEGTIGYRFTEEHRKKISDSNKGRKRNIEAIQNMRLSKLGDKNPMFGRKASEKQKEAARKLFTENNPHKKGELSHMFGKQGYWKGKTQSPEVQEKKRRSMMGKNTGPRPPEVIKKMSAATKKYIEQNGHPGLGKKRSEESREKMRQSRIAYIERQKAIGLRYNHTQRKQSKEEVTPVI